MEAVKYVYEDKQLCERICAEFDSWLGTPWVHLSAEPGHHKAIKGVQGDCVHVVVAAFENLRLIPSLVIPAHEAHPGTGKESIEQPTLSKTLRELTHTNLLERVILDRQPLELGDVLTFRFGAREHHVGVYRGGINRSFWHSGGLNLGMKFTRSSLREHINRNALQAAYRLLHPTHTNAGAV